MLYELYWTLEHKATFTAQLIPGTFSGAPLPLRSIYRGVAPPPIHPANVYIFSLLFMQMFAYIFKSPWV